MLDQARRLARVTVVVVAVASLGLVLPGTAVAAPATEGPAAACRVWNVEQRVGRDSLQRAVWAAAAGDRLLVQGTCQGTTRIDKPILIDGVRLRTSAHAGDATGSGPATLMGSKGRPALVVDPSVRGFRLGKHLVVKRGVVVDRLPVWRGANGVSSGWSGMQQTTLPPWSPRDPRACRVANGDRGSNHRSLGAAIAAAAPADTLTLLGRCRGQVTIDRSITIRGARVAISAITCTDGTCDEPDRRDSGVPTVAHRGAGPAIVVADGVQDVFIEGVRVIGGIALPG